MHRIEGSFSKQRQKSLEKRKKRQLRIKLGLALVSILALSGVLWLGQWLDRTNTDANSTDELVQQDLDEVLIPAYIPAIIDLPGDPIRIELGGATPGASGRQLPAPPTLMAYGVTGSLSVISANIVESGRKLSFALPSTQQDFALFQSQRENVETAPESEPTSAETMDASPEDALNEVPTETGQGTFEIGSEWESIEGTGLDGANTSYEATAIADTTSTLLLTSEQMRAPITEDFFVRVTTDVDSERFLVENNVNLVDAKKASTSLSRNLGSGVLASGTLVAMRQLRTGNLNSARKLVQIALYKSEQFVAAFALDAANGFQSSADPWANQQVFRGTETTENTPPRQSRLLDSIFSAGLRQGIPASIVGEAIMYLSRQFDLGDLAHPDDKMTIVFADRKREGAMSDGRVLFISLMHKGKSMQCFVYKPEAASDFKCLDENDTVAEIEVSNGIVVPVAGGVLTSGFGPRKHPILKTVLLHKGVDWAAPVGTPVLAAMDGTIVFAGDGGNYGNLVKISHDGGRETRYAHLNDFSKISIAGQNIKAGDTIGFIGTTGRSTGPHLHFEYYAAGQPTDPLATPTQSVVASAEAGDAIAQLVNRIVHVESGGNATAKNPLSTATGLGQFIDSTWLRMMRTYRQDLANSLSKEKLLALRFDPTLSREMVTNLAKENRNYLVSGGVQITSGRLYLAHFLGPEGARLVLSSDDYADLEALLGGGVINANPFLRGKNVAYLKDWGERKMKGRGYTPQPQNPVVNKQSVERASPAFVRFKEALISLAAKG